MEALEGYVYRLSSSRVTFRFCFLSADVMAPRSQEPKTITEKSFEISDRKLHFLQQLGLIPKDAAEDVVVALKKRATGPLTRKAWRELNKAN